MGNVCDFLNSNKIKKPVDDTISLIKSSSSNDNNKKKFSINNFVSIMKLGEGSYGKVFLV